MSHPAPKLVTGKENEITMIGQQQLLKWNEYWESMTLIICPLSSYFFFFILKKQKQKPHSQEA